jgi:hypothetical protein
MILPPESGDLVRSLLPTFTQPTAQRFLTLLVAAVLTPGRRTTANLLRTLRHLAPGHPTAYRRVLSRAPGSGSGAPLPGSCSTTSCRPGRSIWSATTRSTAT